MPCTVPTVVTCELLDMKEYPLRHCRGSLFEICHSSESMLYDANACIASPRKALIVKPIVQKVSYSVSRYPHNERIARF